MDISQFNGLTAACGFDNGHGLPLPPAEFLPVDYIFSRLHTFPRVVGVFSPQTVLVIVASVSTTAALMLAIVLAAVFVNIRRQQRRMRRWLLVLTVAGIAAYLIHRHKGQP